MGGVLKTHMKVTCYNQPMSNVIGTYKSFDSTVLILTGLGVVLLDLGFQSRVVGSLQNVDPKKKF